MGTNKLSQPLTPTAAFKHLSQVMSSQRFLNKDGLGNEVPFFIFPYDPKQATEMEQLPTQLKQKLGTQKIDLLLINLYDLSIQLIKERDIWDQLIETETDLAKDELLELLQGVLDAENHLIPAIEKIMLEANNFSVLCLYGVGAVFPYIRSHTILNNLQRVAKDKPTLLFFPGEYSHSAEHGTALSIFSLAGDDKYYRAYNILDIQP